MAKFRSPSAQAEHAIRGVLAIGEGRHSNRDDGKIHSLGTARSYEQTVTQFATYLQANRAGNISTATKEIALQYLKIRGTEVRQKTLDQHCRLQRVRSGP